MFQRKIRVLHLLPAFTVGGPGNVVKTLINNIDRSQFEISCCSMYSSQEGYALSIDAEIEHICLKMKNFLEPNILLKLAKLIKKNSFDIVHTHCLRPDWYGRVTARWCNIPVVSTIHAQDRCYNYIDFGFFKGKIVAAITRSTMRFVNTFIAVSEGVKDYLISFEGIAKERIMVVHNGIEVNEFDLSKINVFASKQKLGILDNTLVVGSVAVLNYRKGLGCLLNAACKVIKFIPNVKFIIVGVGPEENKLKKLAIRLGIEDKVIFMVEQYASVLPIVASMDIFILPSFVEGLGIAVLEAQALKKPCIVTDIPGLRETVIKDQTALVVPPRDEGALAGAILSLLFDKERCLSMGEAGRQHVINNFSASQMARKYERVYKKTLCLS
jgi:glycosyltransferase involved in cell wall biosynthesis